MFNLVIQSGRLGARKALQESREGIPGAGEASPPQGCTRAGDSAVCHVPPILTLTTILLHPRSASHFSDQILGEGN